MPESQQVGSASHTDTCMFDTVVKRLTFSYLEPQRKSLQVTVVYKLKARITALFATLWYLSFERIFGLPADQIYYLCINN